MHSCFMHSEYVCMINCLIDFLKIYPENNMTWYFDIKYLT